MLIGRHFKNEDKIKDMIVDGRKRGVCDKNGRALPKYQQGCFVVTEEYAGNYDKIDWSNG